MRSPTTGFNIIAINMARLLALVKQTEGRVAYLYGSKPHAGIDAAKIKTSDCSGYLRWLLPLSASEHVDVPDGSWTQGEWCKKQGFKATSYKDTAALTDFRLRMAFIPKKGKKPGHVVLILNGRTIECCGGRGVCRRLWHTPVLAKGITACYVLTDPMD